MTRRNSLSFPLALGCAAVVALAGCSSAPAAQDAAIPPANQSETDAQLKVAPGKSSCSFNNELPDYAWDGSGTYSGGELSTATLEESEDAYVVTFSGSFFDPSVLVTDSSRFSAQVLLSHGDAKSVALVTEFDGGELSFTGLAVNGTETPTDTDQSLTDGTFTASYPKDTAGLADYAPDMWAADVYFDDGIDQDLQPVSFRCGDGRSWEWQPAPQS